MRALSPDPEQPIEVPKILPVDVPLRTSVREPQLVEQLVEVQTIVSFSSLQRIAEQNVDIPVVGGSGTGGDLSGFLPGQHYSMTAEQIVDNPVPWQGVSVEIFKVFHQDRVRRSGLRTRSLTFQFQVEDFPQTLHRAGVSSDLPDEANQGVFSTFPRVLKKCEDPVHPGVGTASALEPMDAVRLAGVWYRGCFFLVAERQKWCSLVCSSGLPSYPVARSSRWCRTGAACQPWRLLEEFPLLRACLAVLFALGKLDTSPLPSYLSVPSGVWVLLVEYSVWFFGTRAPLGSTVLEF